MVILKVETAKDGKDRTPIDTITVGIEQCCNTGSWCDCEIEWPSKSRNC